MLFFLYYSAITRPGQYYYIANQANQAREIIWSNRRIQDFLPKNLQDKYLVESNRRFQEVDMRVRFKNGSFVKLDGADNFNKYAGINPHGVVYDEYKDHRPEFDSVMRPNLATNQGQLLVVGTPPDVQDHHFWRLKKEVEENDGAYFNFPTWANHHISREWLKKEKAKYISRDEVHLWLINYEAQFARSGEKFIYYSLMKDSHRITHAQMLSIISKRSKDWEFVVTADPAASSCFAVLLSAYNKYSKQCFHLDEIYETKQSELTVRKIWSRINAMVKDAGIDINKVDLVYDEAETWFANEMLNEFGCSWIKTHKSQNDKESGITLIKDQLIEDKFTYSERCVHLHSEMSNYAKDKNGKIKKENDHLLDDVRYFNAHVVAETISVTPKNDDEYIQRDDNYRDGHINERLRLPPEKTNDYDNEQDEEINNDIERSFM
jgi:hypothetical protein